jgi:hypothetical protein
VALLALHAGREFFQLPRSQTAKVFLDAHGRVSADGTEPITKHRAVFRHLLCGLRGALE